MSENINWSDEQVKIFRWFQKLQGDPNALVVRARAGTGKTTTIKAAFSYAPEETMLYAVFNKKNQIEAQEKITDPRVTIKTLHALGFGYILSFWPNVKPDGLVERDRVCAEQDFPSEVVTQVCRLVGFAKNTIIAPTLDSLLDLAEERGIDAGEEFEEAGYTVVRMAELALAAIERAKVRDPQGRISFDDMVWLPIAMGWVRPRFDLVVVDEAQDMNLPQLLMAEKAVRKDGRICVVGDDRQAIYGFRGAASDGMTMMQNRLEAKSLGLTLTYRCPQAVVRIAQELVPDYRVADSAPEGVVNTITLDALPDAAQIGDVILSRLNAPLMSLCLAFLRKGVPARIEGREVGKQLAGIVKKLGARSVPNFMEKVRIWRARQILRAMKAGKEAQANLINDQVETLIAVAEGASGVREIESRLLSLFQDTESGAKPAVVLSSVHKAKGLEWNRVFILKETFCRRAGLEEQNILYVALTRTKQCLNYVVKT